MNDRTSTVTGTTLDPGAAPTTDAPCTIRTYTFDNNGRRTQLQAATHPDGDCTSTTGTTSTTTSYAYDTADRPTTGGNTGTNTPGTYNYDTFGRQTSIPATDAPNPTAGDITLGYYDNDLARTITQGTQTTTLALDTVGRRQTATTTGAPDGTVTLIRHYTDGGDNPTWTERTTDNGTTTTGPTVTRYVDSLNGDLGATIAADGTTDLNIANLHGDNVTTVNIPAAQADTTPSTTIAGWSDYNEYGAPRDLAATTLVGGTAGYGWLGAKGTAPGSVDSVGVVSQAAVAAW